MSGFQSQLVRELYRRPKCGLCSFYPITVGNEFDCPIKGKTVYRTSKPPRIGGDVSMSRYYCFQPTTELAYETRQELMIEKDRRQHREYWKKPGRMETHRENNRRWYENHVKVEQEKMREKYKRNPESQKERSLFRSYIEAYNPLKNVLQMFGYHRRRDKLKGLPFETHLSIKDLMEVQANKQVLGDYGELMPTVDEV